MSLKIRCLSFVIFAFALWSFGCGGRPAANQPVANQPQGQKSNGTPGGTLSVRLATPVKTLNYLMAEDESTIIVAFSPWYTPIDTNDVAAAFQSRKFGGASSMRL